MTPVLREPWRSLRASPIFALYALATLGVAGIIGLITIDVVDLGMTHFGEASHRTHDLTYGFLFTTTVVGLLAQLRRPEKNVAGMVMALVPAGGLLLAAVLAGEVDAIERNPLVRYLAPVMVVAALLHPTGRACFRSFRISRVNGVMLALVGVAVVPLLGLASTNIRLQRTVTDAHAGTGHYGFMAAFSFAVIAVGLLASLRPDGWRLTAAVAGLLPALLGVTSVLYPDTTSSLDLPWALAAIVWGAMFLAAATLIKDAESAMRVGSPGVASGPERPLDAQLSGRTSIPRTRGRVEPSR